MKKTCAKIILTIILTTLALSLLSSLCLAENPFGQATNGNGQTNDLADKFGTNSYNLIQKIGPIIIGIGGFIAFGMIMFGMKQGGSKLILWFVGAAGIVGLTTWISIAAGLFK